MPTNLTSSFASAAAGQSRGTRAGRDGGGGANGEWTRREGRSVNGTLTFRRSSTTPINQTQSSSDHPVQPPPTEAPATQQIQMPSDGSYRYSRDELLEIFKATEAETDPPEISNLLLGGWNPGHVNGNSRGWGKSNEGYIPQDPGVCWDSSGSVRPIGLMEMSLDEREMFTSDVNSTLKLQQQKEGAQAGGVNGRKSSVSHGSNYGLASPSTTSRPGTRRRETTDTNPFPNGGVSSPTVPGRFPRDDSSWFGRRSTDTKEATFEEPEEDGDLTSAKSPSFGTVPRSNTSGSIGFGGAASLWGTAGPSGGSGIGSFGSFALPTTIGDKRFGSIRGESRLAHLIPGGGTDNSALKANDASVVDPKGYLRFRPRSDTDPFGNDDGMSGSAVLRGSQDASPPPLSHMSHHAHPYDTPTKASTGDFGMAGLTIGVNTDENAAGSPETNPYRSPPVERREDESGMERVPAMGHSSDHASNFGSLSRPLASNAFDGSDRSQTSSVGAKGFSALSTIGGGWPSALGTGTPDRERPTFTSAFGSSIFSPVGGDLQSPSFGSNVPGVFGPGAIGGIGTTGSFRGSSKMGSLFPAAMQAQMQQDQESLSDSIPELRQANPLGAIGAQVRETDGTVRPRGLYDNLLMDTTRSLTAYTAGEQAQASIIANAPPPPFESTRSSTDTPLNQPRTMVMPDRMRWVYLDPQSRVQGPFTGLEMNDWYKASFFSADLRVKKVEDPDFEPLGQLIRRIGNSREPFLVPQMGIAHGQPSISGSFSQGDRGTIVPPLVGAFPSFGRTLTAEEQNNLEQRKQEEQFMLARQREMMVAQQHVYPKMQAPSTGAPATLNHHSSAHSLQSQPSFGSMTSPIGPPQAPIGAMGSTPGFLEQQPSPMTQPHTQPGLISNPDFLRDDLNFQERQVLASLQASGGVSGMFAPQSHASAPPVEAPARSNLPTVDQLQKDPQGFSERLKEFNELRAQHEAEEAASTPAVEPSRKDEAATASSPQAGATQFVDEIDEKMDDGIGEATAEMRQALSLTQQVQKAQAAAAAKHGVQQGEDVWPKASSDLPMPFPPPQGSSSTPLPAPTARRTRSTLPDQYAASRSQSETPESATAGSATQAPPLAPWAREPGAESHKGPSLKEIQEAEAKKAAKAEEAAAAARRAAAEQEAALLREREKISSAAAAPGLPTTSTWGNGSPVAPTTNSPWSKPGAAKGAAITLAASSSGHISEKKKTLADIQREEEARKQKAKEQAVQSGAISAAKRYADLASKGQPAAAASTTSAPAGAVAASSANGSGWATVGAGGKVKIPTGPAANRSVSTGTVKPAAPTPVATRPAAKQNATPTTKVDVGGAAMEEFNKWLHRELSRGITGGIDINGFADSLLQLPLDQTIISDAVYASSTTMDGRHFAQEFLRRKKLADNGIVEKQPTAASSSTDNKSGGGWSEVAKKGGGGGGGGSGNANASGNQKEESLPSGFKVVPGRKKGKK